MTDLYDRLFPQFDDSGAGTKIPSHQFTGALDDYVAGYTTRNQIVGAWSLDADAQADLDKLLAHVDGIVGVQAKVRWLSEFHSTCMLAEGDLKYTTKQSFATRVGMV